MDNIRNTIEILFSKSNPEKIIQAFFKGEMPNDLSESISRDPFLVMSEILGNNKTKDELESVYNIVKNKWSKSPEDNSLSKNHERKNVFYVLNHFANEVLSEQGDKPICEFLHLLRWRDLSYKLGEDIFTTAFFAGKDLPSKRERHYFSWLPTISTNNCHLQEILERGITDIHFHLYGSSLNFDLSWLSLMNHITDRKEEFDEIKNSKVPDINPWFGENQLSLYALCIKAFAIRQMLFKILIRDHKENKNNGNVINELYLTVLRCKTEEELRFYTGDLQNEVDILKHLYGKKYGNDCVDYTIKKTFSDKNYDPDSYHNSVLYGERWLMYKMFKLIFSDEKERTFYKPFFYAYLIIKTRLRNELIQVNKYPGFRNFQEYQNRKSLFLNGKPVYEELLVNIAVNNALQSLYVKYLETRVSPRKMLKDNMTLIDNLDKAVHSKKFKLPATETQDKKQINRSFIHDDIDDIFNKKYIDNKDRYFYIFHFLKKKDKDYHKKRNNGKEEILEELVNPRHFELRQYIKEQAMAINLVRRQTSSMKERLVGIDAAGSEIGCRPEVFAQAFRYLKKYSTELDNIFLTSSSILHLGYTYHVGEDFLDIADGLRAIDEVVKFLNFNRGDRLGHCLALGINTTEYYEKKKNYIVLSKQDFLDNVVWLMMQIKIYNIASPQSLFLELQNHYTTLMHEIYEGEVTDKQKDSEQKTDEQKWKKIDVFGIPVEIYYLSWLLRGDDPYMYFDYKERFNPITFWERCGRNDLSEFDAAHKNSIARALYKAYHFSAKTKQRGRICDEFKISRDYVELIKNIQNKMMHSLARKHIAIETNPTSNKLIGDYKLYADLPLKRFFNLGLTYDSKELASNPQLSVSLNTDDLGVFSTSIENEYALMAIALEKAMTLDGEPQYISRMIYDWLDRIRSMGFEQRFKKDVL